MKKTKKRGKKKSSGRPAAAIALLLFFLCIVLLAVAAHRSHSVKLPKGAPLPIGFSEENTEKDGRPKKTDENEEADTAPKTADGKKTASDETEKAQENESPLKTEEEPPVGDIGSDIPHEAVGADIPAETVSSVSEEAPPAADSFVPAMAAEIPVSVTGISLSVDSVALTVGQSRMPIVTMYPTDASDKREIWTCDNTQVAVVNGYGNITGISAGVCTVTVCSRENPAVSALVSVTVTEPIEPEVTYINGILIANKSYPLPADYNPGTDPTAKEALDAMIAAAREENISLWVRSGFRSYATQKILYNSYARRDGSAAADRYSARPGYSEHQTGLAFDLNSLSQSFADTAEGKWLAAHCSEYGFIIRYPKDKESVTGYMYEPWHVRYLGTETAKAVADSGLTLEEYLGITSVYAS